MESEGSTLLFDMNMNENPIDQAHPSIDRLTMRRIVIDLRDHTKDAFEETKQSSTIRQRNFLLKRRNPSIHSFVIL